MNVAFIANILHTISHNIPSILIDSNRYYVTIVVIANFFIEKMIGIQILCRLFLYIWGFRLLYGVG